MAFDDSSHSQWIGRAASPGWYFDSGVIAFPTDTVYGLGCHVDDVNAIETIYTMKGRDETKPLILLGHSIDVLRPYIATVPPLAKTLMAKHWPGALTLVLPKSERVPNDVTRGLHTVGCRIPNCPVLLDFLTTLPKGVLATTSANRSNKPNLTQATQVQTTFANELANGLLKGLLVSDVESHGAEPSTVAGIDTHNQLTIFRQGSIDLSGFLP